MHYILFSIGKVTIYTYGLMMALAIGSAILLSFFRAKRKGLSQDAIIDIAIYGVVFGIIGAKVVFFLTEIPEIIKNPSFIKDTLSSGFVLYGSLMGGVGAAYVYCRIKKLDFLKYFDLVVPGISLGQSIGRIGCFFAGCCYGRETSLPIGITFKNSPFAPNGVKLIPTQLISSVGDLVIMAVLLKFASKERKKGQTAGLYMILYSIGRFLVEILRNDPRGNVGALSTSQFICMFVFVLGIFVFNLNKIKTFKTNGQE